MRLGILFMLALAVLDGQNIKTGPAVGNPVPDFSAQDQKPETNPEIRQWPERNDACLFRWPTGTFRKTQLVELNEI
jgi:hypothetical protein